MWSRWRPRSLRGRLLIYLMLPLLILATGLLLEADRSARGTATRLFDKTLLAVTIAMSEHVLRWDGDLLSESFLEVASTALRDDMYYHVRGPGGAFVTGYPDAPSLPEGVELAGGTPVFFDAEYGGRPVRVAALRQFIDEPRLRGWLLIRVWQTTEERQAIAQEMLFRSGGRVGLLLVLAMVAGWYGLRQSLRPLDRLEGDVARRGARDLRPIAAEAPREVRHLVDALNQLFGRLDAALAEREHFIANAAHQLRTPLAGLLAQVDLMTRAKDDESVKAGLRGIALSARHVSRLADQLLSLARIEERADEMANQEVDVVELTRGAARDYAARALAQGIEIAFESDQEELKVQGDRVMLGEAIRNLLDNAIRYGAGGGCVTVHVGRENGWAILGAIDQGPGIPRESRQKVLQRFVRLAGGADGSGLGLAIVQDVAERHGGHVELDDGPSGRGLAARLRLPMVKTAA